MDAPDWSKEAGLYLPARGILPETAKQYGAVVDPAPTPERLKDRLNQNFNGDRPKAVLWFDAGWVKDGNGCVPTIYLARCFPPITRYGKENKFLTAYDRPQQPYILPPSLMLSQQLDVPVVITEGPSRALLLSQSGICCVSLSGIWNATLKRTPEDKATGVKLTLHPVLKGWVWPGREVLLSFDQDYLSNQSVLHGVIRNLVLFSAAGSEVRIPVWDKAKGKGLDDFIFNQAGLVVAEQTRVINELFAGAMSAVDFLAPRHVDLVLKELGEISMSPARRHQLAKAWAKKLGTTVEALRGPRQEPKPQAVSTDVGVDPEPWGEEVNLNDVIDALHTEIKTYIALEEYNVTIVVFWIIFTWIWEGAHYIPLLVLTSPEKGCGKSTLRDIIAALVRRPLRAVGVSDGSIHRLIGNIRPTLLVDQAHTMAADTYPNTIVVLNSGWEWGDKIPRYNAETNSMEWFDPVCPKLVAGIGTFLDEQTLSRSFIVELRRATAEEEATLVDGAFFEKSAPHIVELRRKLLRWVIDNGQEYKRFSREVMWEMPKSIRGRDKNKFASVLAIAKLVPEGNWTELLTQAAFLSLAKTAAHANESLEHRLLCDCYKVVTVRTDLLVSGAKDRGLFIATDLLLQELWKFVEAPWYAMPKSGKPLKANQLFFYLKRYKIESALNSAGTLRGVYVERITEEYNRYKARSAQSNKPKNDDGDKSPPEPPPPPKPPSSPSPSTREPAEKVETENSASDNPISTESDSIEPENLTPASDLTPAKNRCQIRCQTATPSTPTGYPIDLTPDTYFQGLARETFSSSPAPSDLPSPPSHIALRITPEEHTDLSPETERRKTPENRCQVSDAGVNSLDTCGLRSDTSKITGVRSGVRFNGGVRFPNLDTDPFPGLLGEWDRLPDGLEVPNTRFRQLLFCPSQWLAVDIETFAPPVFGKNKKKPLKTDHALNPWIGSIRLIAFADAEQIHQFDLLKGELSQELRNQLSAAGWISHNAGFELLYLGLHFGIVPQAVFCTRIANALLTNGMLHHAKETSLETEPKKKQSEKKKKESLNSYGRVLAERVGVVLPKDQGDSDWGGELTEAQREYSLNDVRYLNVLASKELTTIRADGLETVCMLETLLLPVVTRMRCRGFSVDREKLEYRRQEYAVQAQARRERAQLLLGAGSPKLGDNRKVDGLLDWIQKQTGKRLSNMQEATLKDWEHPLGHAIVDYKQTQKRLRTFEALLKHSALDGRVHPDLNQMGAVTGRFSCAEPNAQQMEKVSNLFRDCYIASGPDRCLIVADYKHIELRTAGVFAHAATGLRTLLDLFLAGLDPHTITAADVLSRPGEDVNKEDRQTAKAVNFGFVYGQQASGFLTYAKESYGVILTLTQAELFRRNYFLRYPDLAGWHQWAWDEVEHATESRTILGRRHLIPPTTSTWNKFQALVNTPACGSAAELLKWSMIELDRALPSDSYLVMCVHDELVVDAPIARAEEIKQLMKRVMAETFAKLFDNIIPGPADVSFGPNWEAAKP